MRSKPRIGKRVSLAPEESFLELAIKENLNPWMLVTANDQGGSWDLIPGEVLFVPGTESSGPGGLPDEIQKVDFSPDRFVQGHTYVIEAEISPMEPKSQDPWEIIPFLSLHRMEKLPVTAGPSCQRKPGLEFR